MPPVGRKYSKSPEDIVRQISSQAMAMAIKLVDKKVTVIRNLVRDSILEAADEASNTHFDGWDKEFLEAGETNDGEDYISAFDAIVNAANEVVSRKSAGSSRAKYTIGVGDINRITKENPFFPYYEYGGKLNDAPMSIYNNLYDPETSGKPVFYLPFEKSQRRPGTQGILFPIKKDSPDVRRMIKFRFAGAVDLGSGKSGLISSQRALHVFEKAKEKIRQKWTKILRPWS